ncbi:MAG: efflux transporter outer membrane subunit [Steroidobacteraceae bacterium]
MKSSLLAAGAAGVLLVSACGAIPPRQAQPELRSSVPLDGLQLGATTGSWPARSWWQRYEDPTLSELIERALANAPTLAGAQARFDTARANVRQVGLASGVHFDAEASSTYQRLSDNGLFPPEFLGFHWYDQTDLGLRARYTFDWWGKQRLTLQSANDQAQANRIETAATGLNLAGLVAQAYFGWQSDQARLALANQRLANLQRLQSLIEARQQAGLAREDELQQAQLLASGAREQKLALEQSAELRRVVLAALLGCAPAQLPTLSAKPLPTLDATLPGNLSLDLVARRPDIAAAYWRVQSAVHNLDAIRAGYYPDISISALAGVSSLEIGKLLRTDSGVPAIGAAIHLPMFDMGQLKADRATGQARLAEALAAYNSAVFDAARDVGQSTLLRQRLQAQSAEHARQLELLVQQRQRVDARLDSGLSDARAALEVERQWLDSEDAQTELLASTLAADIDLTRALGGGYQPQ